MKRALPMIRTRWKPGAAHSYAGRVTVSYTQWRPNSVFDIPKIGLAGLRMRSWWPGLEGAVGVSLYWRPHRRVVGSLSVWEDTSAIRGFVSRPFHVEIMRRNRPRGELRSAMWEHEPGGDFALAAAYAEGERRLADETTAATGT